MQTSISLPVNPVSNLPPESLCVCEPVSLLTRCKLRVASKFHEFQSSSGLQLSTTLKFRWFSTSNTYVSQLTFNIAFGFHTFCQTYFLMSFTS